MVAADRPSEAFGFGRALFDTASGQVALDLEIADTPGLKLGLMYRESFSSERGMLFVPPKLRTTGPHMENVRFPLSVAFVDDAGTILEILEMDPCREPPCHRYDPAVPFSRALEVNRGAFERLGVHVGDHVQFLDTRGSGPEA